MILPNSHAAKNIGKITNTTIPFDLKNMFDSLSLDIICSFTLTVFMELRENCSLCETDNVSGHISEHISGPNGGEQQKQSIVAGRRNSKVK